MTLTAIGRTSSLVEDVCTKLAAEIRGHARSGDSWLPPERELAGQLGVSRTVIREATKRLEQQGLLEVQHGVGIRMVDKLHRPLNGSLELLIANEAQRLRQLNETRLALEPEAARMVAEKATLAQISGLRQLNDALAVAPDTARAIELDMAFHRAMAEASGNHIFRLILDSLAELGLASRQRTIGRVGKTKAVEHHAAILTALERRDAKGAALAMRRHIIAAGEDMALDELKHRNAKT